MGDEVTAGPGRRGVLAGAGAAGAGVLGVAVLGGCASAGSGGGSGGAGSPGSVPSKIKGKVIAKKADIPVRGGKVFVDYKLVITQPAKGTFKAFSAVCTHQGCTVGDVDRNVIHCPCHGSEFSAEDGSVKQGPAKRQLKEFTVEENGDGLAVT